MATPPVNKPGTRPFQEPISNWSPPRRLSPQLCSLRPIIPRPFYRPRSTISRSLRGKNGWSSLKSILEAPDCFPIPCDIAARPPNCSAGSRARVIRDRAEPAEVPSCIVREKNARVWVAIKRAG
jgi:hypothetical protein